MLSTAAAAPYTTAVTPTLGPNRSGPHGLTPLGATRPDTVVSLTLLLRFPGVDALRQYLAAQRAAGAPTRLTPAQIGERFGLPTARLDAAVSALARAGITVTERFDQHTALLAEGPARAVERLFGVRLDDFREPDGSRVRVPSRQPRILANLADVVTEVDGLDTQPAFHSHAVLGQAKSSGGSATYLTPQQLGQVYGANALTRAGVDGRGETIAIASLGAVHGDEFSLWAKRFKVTTDPMQQVIVRPAAPTSSQKGWDPNGAQEAALDLEMARSLAPGATLLNYTTQNDGPSLDRIVNQVTQDQRATILSISWGDCELAESAATIRNSEASYMAAEAAGIDVFAASGDAGPYGCNDHKHQSDRRLSVDYPASSAHVAAVGGTTLIHQGGRLSETAWQEPASINGAGGGLSAFVPEPPFQLPAVVHDVHGERAVPDIAGPASPDLNLGIDVYASGHVSLAVAGGTSAAAPFWAGTTALVKQALRGRVGHGLDGNIKAFLYVIGSRPAAYAAAFNDVTRGGNDVYSAGPGWDVITGLGSPTINALPQQVAAVASNG